MKNTRLLSALNPSDVDEAARILRRGGLVALPTETVYGLAGRALDDDVVRAIFAAKGRPADNPVIVHVRDVDDAVPLWAPSAAVERARDLARRHWPGPLTIVAPRAALVSDVVTAGLGKVGVRAPRHDAFRAVLALVGEPLAAPSANASGRPSPTTADDVLASLDGKIDAVLDGGPCAVGIESTVVDVSGDVAVVLRPGAVDVEGAVKLDATDVAVASAASPGLRHRHYAPAIARIELLDVDDDAALHRAWLSADVALLLRASTAAKLTSTIGARANSAAPVEVLPDDAAGYARALYAALYRVERARPGALVVEDVPNAPEWNAVRDRVKRATS